MRDLRDEFCIDTDLLHAVISEMQAAESALAFLARQVDETMTALQALWHGEAAEAQQLAQAEWQRGLTEMRTALTTYRTNAGVAHGNYVEAAQANARMWGQTT